MLEINFADESTDIPEIKLDTYKVLIIDDEQSIHDITKLALTNMNFVHFKVEVLHAMSAAEAEMVLLEHKDIALALVDVVMETPTAGLDLVNKIRNEYKNEFIRLVIRTGQSNDIPAMDVIQKYDIDDYKEKTELTIEKLYTTVRNAIKQYRQLIQLQTKYEETLYQMTHDSLTKLPNRVQLNNDCEFETNKTLILIDIIGFSMINDTNGFMVGDMVLKELAAFLHSMYSDEYNIYHLEADLFALTIIDGNLTDLSYRIEKMKKDISELLIIADNFNKTIDTTFGVAYQSGNNLMRKAELALKEAREEGKNSIKFYSNDLKIIKRIENTNLWGSRIKEAIIENRIKTFFQPIVDFKTKEPVKYESLVRLEYENEIYSPWHFLDAAKYSGQLYEIFKIMLVNSCKKAKETGFSFSVNLTNTDLLQADCVEYIIRTLQECEVDTSLISFEILENNSITGSQQDVINRLSSLGFEIAIDDFGVHCSNFGQLSDLSITTLKIDGSFIKNICDDVDSQIIVKSIMFFAKSKNLKVVAEFVCSEEVYNYTKELGIDYAQGYYFSEPLEYIPEKK
ncbi:EAL domain-containing protein [Sulfurimonas sp. SAG-AH-194-C21]|nr:GGDEF and EAL domain-containing protein [Sulfurimonas sp. SAG-AH-194-C21]MDF1883606.1 EAL domain-containing protein [Sulfurimonas sp. SAG-AH-194-C21]